MRPGADFLGTSGLPSQNIPVTVESGSFGSWADRLEPNTSRARAGASYDLAKSWRGACLPVQDTALMPRGRACRPGQDLITPATDDRVRWQRIAPAGGGKAAFACFRSQRCFYLDRAAMAKTCWPPAFCCRNLLRLHHRVFQPGASLLCFCREYRLRSDLPRRYRSAARMTAAAVV